jgi:hypothetical protein
MSTVNEKCNMPSNLSLPFFCQVNAKYPADYRFLLSGTLLDIVDLYLWCKPVASIHKASVRFMLLQCNANILPSPRRAHVADQNMLLHFQRINLSANLIVNYDPVNNIGYLLLSFYHDEASIKNVV